GGVAADPVDRARREVDAVARPAAHDEQVRAAGVAHELRRNLPAGDERAEVLLALPDGAAVVGLAVHDQRRRRDLLDVRDGREASQRLTSLRELGVQLPWGEPRADV